MPGRLKHVRAYSQPKHGSHTGVIYIGFCKCAQVAMIDGGMNKHCWSIATIVENMADDS
jgi:hypothetical protein